jgi:outer membrane protein assembly factor BamA
MPYHFAASPEIVAQSGASLKHSITGTTLYNNYSTDSSNLPVHGLQMQCSTEIALPPGDIGFFKGQVAIAGHLPIITNRLALHTSLNTGYLHSLSYGGLCGPPLISDRFVLGGTGSFRGFIPAGIGPRGRRIGSRQSNDGLGDALGGNLFYTASLMASFAPSDTIEGISQITRNLRLFGFTTVGSCLSVSNDTSWKDVVGSSRISAGIGIASGALGPRIEATYTLPLRHGPIDGRRRFQLGICISIV